MEEGCVGFCRKVGFLLGRQEDTLSDKEEILAVSMENIRKKKL